MKIGLLEINLRRVGIFISIGVLLVLVMNFNTRLEELSRLTNEAATVQARATAVIVTKSVLQTQLAQATSAAAAEKFAREESGMAKPGDKVLVPLPAPGFTPEPTPTATPILTNLTSWEVWMELLFSQ